MPADLNAKDVPLYRNLLLIAGGIYFLWWFAVESLLTGAFNPLPGRLAVCGVFFGIWILSFGSAPVRRHLKILYKAALWLLTLHYFYLLHGNGGGNDWVIGSFITVLAISYAFLSLPPLLAYSVFVALLSAGLLILLPPLRHSVFLPGIATILLQANIGLMTRLKVWKRLMESNERFELLFHSTAEGVLVHENRQVIDSNEALARMLGYSREELTGMDLLELVAPDLRSQSEERISVADATPYETKGLRKDGIAFDVEVRAKDILYEGKTLRLVTVRDLTDRKKIEAERIKSQAMREKIRVLDEFISLASHELKTPLTSLKLWIQMLDRDLKKLDSPPGQRTREITGLVGKQITRLASLVETMLDVSQISARELRLDRKSLDLATLTREITDVLRPQSGSLEVDAPDTLPMTGDAARLAQMLENLLTNALKYGGPNPIHVTLRREGGEAVLVVADSGLGIAPENIDRIFERFERVNSSLNVSGLGLGLFLTKQIVEAHGGTILVSSEPGRGSAFTVRLPLAPNAP